MRVVVAFFLLALVGAAFAAPAAFAKRESRLGTAECDICTWVVTQAEAMLAKNSTEQEIITDLDKVAKR